MDDILKNNTLNNDWFYSEIDRNNWLKAFKKLSLTSRKRGLELFVEFLKCDIKIISEKTQNLKKDLVLICIAKNECENLKLIYEYHKKLGVSSFAFIDNDSKDNTIEEFKKYEDVNLYSVEDMYTSLRRQAWINKIMAHYGFNKWYLVIDSDEFLAFNDDETKTIQNLIEFCKDKKIKRVKALMLDMYPKKIKFDGKKIDYLAQYKFFDTNTYTKLKGINSLLLDGMQGGVRKRIFLSENNKELGPWLTKYPLLYLEKGDIQFQSHMSFPYYKNFNSYNYLILRHYKFLSTDYDKYLERIKNKNFANGSIEYQRYIEKMKEGYIEFYENDISNEFIDSNSFYAIKELKKIPWKENINEN